LDLIEPHVVAAQLNPGVNALSCRRVLVRLPADQPHHRLSRKAS